MKTKEKLHIFYFKIGILLSFVLLFGKGIAQQSDFLNWYGVKSKYKLTKKADLKFEGQLRTWNNASQFQLIYGEIGVNREVTKFYKVQLVLRSSLMHGKVENRGSFDHKFKVELSKKIEANYTFKTQVLYSKKSFKELRLRNKFMLEYKINKKLKTEVFSEFFYKKKYNYSNVNQIRLGINLNIDLKKKNSFDLFFYNDKEINREQPINQWILGAQFTFGHKKKLFKNKE